MLRVIERRLKRGRMLRFKGINNFFCKGAITCPTTSVSLIASLAEELEREFGSGFSKRQLELSRQFYRCFPIANTLCSQLNRFQYRLLIRIADAGKREYYQLEAVKNRWSGKELERQINAQLYERLLASNDKESVLAVARGQRQPETAREIIKDPMYLEFLGLEHLSRASYASTRSVMR